MVFGGVSGTEAQQRYYRAFKEKYPGIASTQQGWVDTVLREKQLKTCTGLVFYWPDTTMSRSGYVNNNEAIHNYPIQSFATADIIPVALVYQYHRMKAAGMKSFIVNTIHDSTITEIHPEEIELYRELVVKAFTEDVCEYIHRVYGLVIDVPLGAGVKIGEFWGEAEEQKYEYMYAA